jgi:hypothetical protein
MDICIDFRGPGDAMCKDFEGMERIQNLSDVRQGMVNDYLRPEHTHVLMVDADVDYTPKTVTSLLRTSEVDIVAPAVMGEGDRENDWYDTFAFIDMDSQHATREPPYFDNTSSIVPMWCVGTMYMVPADLFRAGARYRPIKGFTEHLSVCEFARGYGRRVLCNREIVVRHPRLDDFGEKRE